MYHNYHDTWAILPSTQVLFDKTKCTVADLFTIWVDNDVLICERNNGFGKKPSIVMIAGSHSEKIGHRHGAHHDQTGKSLGEHIVIAKFSYNKVDGKLNITKIDKAEGFEFDPTTFKAPLFVFK
jgi:hypothetical protein